MDNEHITTTAGSRFSLICASFHAYMSRSFVSLFFIEAIPIPADQPIMQIKDLDEVVIPTMEIKVKNVGTSFIIPNVFCLEDVM